MSNYAMYGPDEICRAFAVRDPEREDKLDLALRSELAADQPADDACRNISALLDAKSRGKAEYWAQYNVELEENDEKEC